MRHEEGESVGWFGPAQAESANIDIAPVSLPDCPQVTTCAPSALTPALSRREREREGVVGSFGPSALLSSRSSSSMGSSCWRWRDWYLARVLWNSRWAACS